MIHLAGPYLLAAVLAGLGTFGVLARRNAVLVAVCCSKAAFKASL